MSRKVAALIFAAKLVMLFPLVTQGGEKNLCTTAEINIASCETTKGKYVSFCANQGGNIHYRFGGLSKSELIVKFSEKRKMFRWIDIETYTTFFGFNRGGYSYVFGVPQETFGATAFLIVKKSDEVLSYNDTYICVSNSFGDKYLKNKAIQDVQDSLIRTKGGLMFPPLK